MLQLQGVQHNQAPLMHIHLTDGIASVKCHCCSKNVLNLVESNLSGLASELRGGLLQQLGEMEVRLCNHRMHRGWW